MDKVGEKTLEIMSRAAFYNDWLLSIIKPHTAGRILEVGAGIGNFTAKLAKFGRVTAIDYNRAYKNAKYGDIEKGKYFFKSRKFDSIVCLNVLEHIKDDGKSLGNINKLLKKEGKLILLVPAHAWAYGDLDQELGHYRRYTKEKLVNMLKKLGFRVLVARYINFLGIFGWWFNAKILKKKIIPTGQLGLFDRIARPFLLMEKYISFPVGLSVFIVGEKI